MQTEVIEGAVENRILTGMVVNKSVLGRIAARWDGKLFRARWNNIAGDLCVQFYKKHGDAPQRAIVSLFESWAEDQRDRSVVAGFHNFIAPLFDDYQRAVRDADNVDHIVDVAGKHFRTVRLEALKNDLEACLHARDADRAEKIIAAYRKVELGMGSGIDLFTDDEEMRSLFSEERKDVLVEYSGAAGEFFGNDFARDSFVVFQGTAKSGKSFWLQDIAWRAMCARKKVAYFEAGDLSKHQAEMRFAVRVASHPSISTNRKPPYWPCTVDVPVTMRIDKDAKSHKRRALITESRSETFEAPLDYATTWRACERVMRRQVRSKKSYFKLSVHANSTLTIDTIQTILDGYAVDGFVPDVLIVDYADIMAWPRDAHDERAAINANWQQLRRLSQQLHCLVVTGTQADADAYSIETQTRKNFSGDRRKNDHVTAIHAINMTDDEKEAGTCRLNTLGRRDGYYNAKVVLFVAQCFPLGRPCVLSSY